MNWKTVSQFQAGGLGVHSLVQFNIALLGKWLWSFATEKDALCRKIMEKKYNCERGGWCSWVGWGHYGVCCGRILERVGANFPDSSVLRLIVVLLIKNEKGW